VYKKQTRKINCGGKKKHKKTDPVIQNPVLNPIEPDLNLSFVVASSCTT
jgi:hypothetical protein